MITQGASLIPAAPVRPTAIVGGFVDNTYVGAAWVWTRSGGVWTQQGTKLVGSDTVGPFVQQGYSVSLSGDGNTAIVGGPDDNRGIGAAWVFAPAQPMDAIAHRTSNTVRNRDAGIMTASALAIVIG